MATDRQARISGGFGAGVGAALVMMLVMLVIRFTTNTISIPELIEKRLTDLVGGQIELFLTDNLGIGGRAFFLVVIVEVTVLLRGLLGWAFTRLWPVRHDIVGWRWISGLLYGLILGLVYNLVFLPHSLEVSVAPDFANSPYNFSLALFGVPVWLNLFLSSAVFGLALVALLPWPHPSVMKAPPEAVANTFAEVSGSAEVSGLENTMSRRDFTKVLAGGAMIALAGGTPLWYGTRQALVRGSLVTRAAYAANGVGWRQLGVLNGASAPNANFRESDILYNPDDRMYYVFSTEGDGNPPPPTPILASSEGAPTTITAPGHRAKVGMEITISGHFNDFDDKNSALNNRQLSTRYVVSAVNIDGNPDTLQLVSSRYGAKPVTSKGGYGGMLNYLPDPHIAMRRASTPEGITLAGGEDYVEYINSGLWYPTVIKEGNFGSSTWHLWGTIGHAAVGHQVFDGNKPVPSPWPANVAVGASLPLGDVSVRRNPVDGYWYAVGLYSGSSTDMRIYRSNDLASGIEWELVGSVFADGHPSWATTSMPDPNICFVDGRAYVLFSGCTVFGQWSTGIVEVDIATGKAKGASEILLRYGAYPSWMNSVLSDLVFIPSGHDRVDRIFAFGSVPYHSGGNAVWGCLDLVA